MSKIQITENGYNCVNCNLYNDILTIYCKDCNEHRPEILNKLAIDVLYKRNPFGEQKMSDSSKIEAHAKFFNQGYTIYFNLDYEGRKKMRNELAETIFTARAIMNACDQVDREDKAKLSPDGKSWLVTNDDVTSSDALNTPKERQKRMSKADKLYETFKNLGLENADELIANVEKAQSGGSVTTSHNREMKQPAITFNREAKSTNTQESLLADVSKSLVDGMKDRPITDLVEAAKTAGHIANRILNKASEAEVIEQKTTEPFNPAKLFG